jgi:hypothetical protein
MTFLSPTPIEFDDHAEHYQLLLTHIPYSIINDFMLQNRVKTEKMGSTRKSFMSMLNLKIWIG